jgi:hypothetical protein
MAAKLASLVAVKLLMAHAVWRSEALPRRGPHTTRVPSNCAASPSRGMAQRLGSPSRRGLPGLHLSSCRVITMVHRLTTL